MEKSEEKNFEIEMREARIKNLEEQLKKIEAFEDGQEVTLYYQGEWGRGLDDQAENPVGTGDKLATHKALEIKEKIRTALEKSKDGDYSLIFDDTFDFDSVEAEDAE